MEWQKRKREEEERRGGGGGGGASGLMEANSTGFVKDDLITSSPVC